MWCCRCSKVLTGFDALCLFLILTKHQEDHPFATYLNLLPVDYTIPLYCSIPLNSQYFTGWTEKLYSQQCADYFACKRRCSIVFELIEEEFGGKNYLDKWFPWAWATVNSRCIYKENTTDEHSFCNNWFGGQQDSASIALIPFLDMINHSSDSKISCKFNQKSKSFQLVQLDGCIHKGQEIFICYGPHNNARLFLEYGFILEQNPNDSVEFNPDDLKVLCDSGDISEKNWNALILSKITCSEWSKFLYGMDVEEFMLDAKVVNLALNCLNAYINFLKVEQPKKFSDSLPPYVQHCLRKLWENERYIISQCIEELQIACDNIVTA
uniref:SET domain-containing protein n=1 Tax=Romanomermis culicivorax TaxID=13658 RepID=A0A915HS28_ROMCU